MICKPGVCWFRINIILCVAATATCLSCYLFYDGPPQLIDAGMRLIYITSIVSILISFVCILSLSNESRSTCVIIFCDIGLVFVFIVSVYAHHCLQTVQLDPGRLKEYTQNYFKRTGGNVPPFLDSIQQQMKCCGIYGGKDYKSMTTHAHNSSLSIPLSCCVSVKCHQMTLDDEFSVSSENPNLQIKNKLQPGDGWNGPLNSVHFLDRMKDYLMEKDQVKLTNFKEDNQTHLEKNVNETKSQLIHPNSHIPILAVLSRLALQSRIFSEIISLNTNDWKLVSHNTSREGCKKFVETIQSFLSNLPNEEKARDWLTLPLEMKDMYLRFIIVLNLVLIFVFNFYVSRNRLRRRPAVIPRAPPPVDYEDHPMESRAFPPPFYENPLSQQSSEGRVDISVNLSRPRPEFGLHPFMLSAMIQSQDNSHRHEAVNGLRSDVLSFRSFNNNHSDFTPTAPPVSK